MSNKTIYFKLSKSMLGKSITLRQNENWNNNIRYTS